MTSSPSAAKYLWDARPAAERTHGFTRGRSIDDHLGDEMLHSAVEGQFEIVGEALAGLRRIDPDAAVRVADARRARSACGDIEIHKVPKAIYCIEMDHDRLTPILP